MIRGRVYGVKAAHFALIKDTVLTERETASNMTFVPPLKETTMTYHAADPVTISRILNLVRPELCNVATRDELKHRLARLGYGISDTRRGKMLTTVPHGIEIAPIPASFNTF